jgi:hypothetical protein
VKSLETGLVVAHRNSVTLTDAKFKVSQAGRERVLREKRKNVHAGVVGVWVEGSVDTAEMTSVTYNPYLYTSFVTADSKTPIKSADRVFLKDRRIFAQL